MGIGIYMRQVPYSGRVPEAGALPGLYAKAQATQALGSAVGRIGRGIEQLGDQLEEDRQREGQINAVRAEAALDEYTRTLIKDSRQMSWTDENGLSQHRTILDAWSGGYEIDGQTKAGYDALKKDLSAKLPKSMQAKWLADIESKDEPVWRDAVEKQGRFLREDYITNAASAVVRGPGMAGDIMAAAARREEIRTLFPPEEWPEIALQVDTDIAMGIARFNPDLARQYTKEYLTPAQQRKVGSKIEAAANAAEALQKDNERRLQDETERKLAANVMRRMRGEAVRGAEPEDIEYMIENGLIDPTVGHTWWERVQKPRSDDRQQRTGTYAIMSREHARLVRGEITPRRYFSVLAAHGHELAEEDEEIWTDRGNAVDDPYRSSRADAIQLAETTLKPLFPAPAANTEATADSPALLSDMALGRIMQELDRYEAEQVKAGQPVDRAAYRTRANEIIGRIYQEEYEKKNPTKVSRWNKYMEAGKPHYLRVQGPNGEIGTITDPEDIRKVMSGEVAGWSQTK